MRSRSWGNYPKVKHSEIRSIDWRSEATLTQSSKPLLAYGKGRSYGDVCLNQDGCLVHTKGLNRLISFDQESGVLHAEAGLCLSELLKFSVPRGWFVPVSPGTKYVTLAGAIANDIHGKNHHLAGTFGRHIAEIELLRSDGQRLVCSDEENRELFRATIAGLGLTGLILSAKIRLKPISSHLIQTENIKFSSLDEFFEISANSDKDFEYTVAWIDCLAPERELGRGIFMRGNHKQAELEQIKAQVRKPLISIPLQLPSFVLNSYSVRAFNFLYYNKQRAKQVNKDTHYDPFFYPLDSVGNWNRIYGKNGFFQFQCVVPRENAKESVREILMRVEKSQQGSFLSVLKEFGELESPGMLSFPRPGTTLCLDFANRGKATVDLIQDLHQVVVEADGAIYPAKDALMSTQQFRRFFPNWEQFSKHMDPNFSSSFWRRVN